MALRKKREWIACLLLVLGVLLLLVKKKRERERRITRELPQSPSLPSHPLGHFPFAIGVVVWIWDGRRNEAAAELWKKTTKNARAATAAGKRKAEVPNGGGN